MSRPAGMWILALVVLLSAAGIWVIRATPHAHWLENLRLAGTAVRGAKPKSDVTAAMVEHQPPPWYTDARITGTVVSEIARDLAEVRFGVPWSDSTRPRNGHYVFRGGVASITNEDYWVYFSSSPRSKGVRADFMYLLQPDAKPTLERVRYIIPAPAGSRLKDWQRLQAVLLDTLLQRLGPLTWSDRMTGRVGIARDRAINMELITEAPPPEGRSSANFRLLKPQGASAAPRPVGLNPIPLPKEPIPKSLVIECRSKRLDLETIDFDSSWDDDEEEPKIPNGDGTLDVIRELRARSSPLAAILESTHASMSQVRSARVAISSAFHAGADPEARDLVLYAAHLWAAKFADSLNGSGQGREPPPADTAVTNEFNQSFSPHGVKLLYDEHWSYWCYNGQFIRSLVGRPHANRWTGYAFLDRMREGWIAPCTGCGSGSVVETDESGPVISRGEAFLKARPESWMAPEIRLMLAEAHETAWSLSIMYPVEENPAWTGYLDAPAHRKQAIALYEGQLRTRPQDPRNVAIRRRLARLRIDVDTSYHKYWCFDD